jgi:hypothetical protein
MNLELRLLNAGSGEMPAVIVPLTPTAEGTPLGGSLTDGQGDISSLERLDSRRSQIQQQHSVVGTQDPASSLWPNSSWSICFALRAR